MTLAILWYRYKIVSMRPFYLCIPTGTIHASGQIIQIIWELSSIVTPHHGSMLSMQTLNPELCGSSIVYNAEQKISISGSSPITKAGIHFNGIGGCFRLISILCQVQKKFLDPSLDQNKNSSSKHKLASQYKSYLLHAQYIVYLGTRSYYLASTFSLSPQREACNCKENVYL